MRLGKDVVYMQSVYQENKCVIVRYGVLGQP